MQSRVHQATKWFAGLAASIGLTFSSNVVAQTAADYGVAPWTETVVSVSEFEPATRLFREVANWRLVLSGGLSRDELNYWQLPVEAGGTFELWCAPEADTGCLRFVRFTGVAQEPIRPAARAWDTGGIYSFMVRSNDVRAVYTEALELGWWAESPPVHFQFENLDIRNVVLTGPHGINIAVYERISPEYTLIPIGRISQGFCTMRMVRDWNASRDFYQEVMGFSVLFSGDDEPEEPAFSNFSIPFNYTPQIKRAASALYPVPGPTGRVEPMQMLGFVGHDHSDKARAPNLGILSIRYPVSDLPGYRAMVEDRGAEVVQQAKAVAVDGIGTVDLFAVRDADGSLTEFYSLPRESD